MCGGDGKEVVAATGGGGLVCGVDGKEVVGAPGGGAGTP